MSMTRKDYVAIAAAVESARSTAAVTNANSRSLMLQGINLVIQELCDALARGNQLFDPTRFEEACNR